MILSIPAVREIGEVIICKAAYAQKLLSSLPVMKTVTEIHLRNYHDALASSVPVPGITGGVKINSGVYAASPEKAGRLVTDFITNPGKIAVRQTKVMDLDKEMVRHGRQGYLFGQGKRMVYPVAV